MDEPGTREAMGDPRHEENDSVVHNESVVHSELHMGSRAAREAGDATQHSAGPLSLDYQPRITDRIRAHPLASLGLAFGAGMLLSRVIGDDEAPRAKRLRR